jgi:hypothetical protein
MDALLSWLPEGLRSLLPDGVWLGIVGFGALVVLLLVLGFLSWVRRLFTRRPNNLTANLEERFAEYPPLPPSSGDRRLTVEGVPVRLRLVALAAAGTESAFDENKIEELLDGILPGLGLIFRGDKPRVRIWPTQVSYQGFANHFHRNTIIPEGDRQLSKWVVLAGRAKLKGTQVMLGLGLEALSPTTVGRRTLDSHEWPTVLRVRVRD